MNDLPKRGRPRRANAKVEALKARHKEDAPPSARTVSVTLAHHDEQQLESETFLLGSALKGQLPENGVLSVTSRHRSGAGLYFRVRPAIFSKSVRGVSILRSIADAANLADKKAMTSEEVELREVGEEEAELDAVVVVIGDRYFSKRDIWHIHLAMMQRGANLLYSGFRGNLWPQCDSSRVERPAAAGARQGAQQPVLGCRVNPLTQVIFKSWSVNMFVLIQVSADLWSFALSGRPYWEHLLECFSQLLEKSLRVQGSGGGFGHYLRMLLFWRERHPGEPGAAGSRDEEASPAAADNGEGDFYEVFWEGFARDMPPAQQLVARVRRSCMQLRRRPVLPGSQVVEASRGNMFECLNIVLDHLDYHHLDRMLRTTGQQIVLLTAGNGLIRSDSRQLYKLTHNRFLQAGPSSFHAFNMICVRQAPMHAVPWVQWPEEPSPTDCGGGGEAPLPNSPTWLNLFFYPEAVFCQCPPAADETVQSSLLCLEAVARHRAPLFVPDWDRAGMAAGSPEGELAGVPPAMLQRPSVRPADAWLWAELREPRLNAYFAAEDTEQYRDYPNNYAISPARFNNTETDSEMMNFMSDMAGLRLEAAPGTRLLKTLADMGAQTWYGPPASGAQCPQDPGIVDGNLVPQGLQSIAIRAANGQHWRLEAVQDAGHLAVHWRKMTEEEEDKYLSAAMIYEYTGFLVRRRVVVKPALPPGQYPVPGAHEDATLAGGELDAGEDASTRRARRGELDAVEDDGWIRSRRIFHLPGQLDWNSLDNIVSGNMPMPVALPYPIERSGKDLSENSCPGWKLRTALKQQLFTLIPKDGAERSHVECFARALKRLGGSIDIGVDPFEELAKDSANHSEEFRAQRRGSLSRFAELKASIDSLCFGKQRMPVGPGGRRGSLDIGEDKDGSSFYVQRRGTTVYVRDLDVPSSFRNSRDWFELFYDSAYTPPKFFHLVVQWIVCSSVHLVHFMTRLNQLADSHGYSLVPLPVAQLFPQPAPYWVWGHDRETNFDRLALYPRRRIKVPTGIDARARGRLNARLLERWLRPPLSFLFVFESPVSDFKVAALAGEQHNTVYQRLKGWVLAQEDGLCCVALREENVYWYENSSMLAMSDLPDWRKAEDTRRCEDLWGAFHSATMKVLRQDLEFGG